MKKKKEKNKLRKFLLLLFWLAFVVAAFTDVLIRLFPGGRPTVLFPLAINIIWFINLDKFIKWTWLKFWSCLFRDKD